ncbi:MAG: LD-carboxypeptidase [Burkholderiaceae bacterium]|nr:LD-carboxypeptidase [Burkholderiaceae bacterium]
MPSTLSSPSSPVPAAFAALPPGATVAIVAPAGPAPAERLAAVPALLTAQGWQARIYPGCHAGHPSLGFLAAPDAQRLADLQAALADPGVAAIWCLRGGHGSARLLPHLDLAAVRAAAKPLIGYSDITALFALWAQAGVPALHAPMPASDLLLPGQVAEAQADAAALFAVLREGLAEGALLAPELQPGAWRLHGAGDGRATGRLFGGNLAVLAALCGTPWEPRLRDGEGGLLFIEDVGEAPYRVDRLLLQLRLAGVLDGLAGVLVGRFSEADDATPVLQDQLGALGLPVLAGWPSGHGRPNRPLPLGLRATLDVAAGTLRLHGAAA